MVSQALQQLLARHPALPPRWDPRPGEVLVGQFVRGYTFNDECSSAVLVLRDVSAPAEWTVILYHHTVQWWIWEHWERPELQAEPHIMAVKYLGPGPVHGEGMFLIATAPPGGEPYWDRIVRGPVR